VGGTLGVGVEIGKLKGLAGISLERKKLINNSLGD
jgi:hypothetical protein|tara:strand:- start:169 stop:273 length:105 start_codon:yes stop_codon:yes gene_type:complete